MFKVEDLRPAKVGLGMIVAEFIDGKYIREFVVNDYEMSNVQSVSNDHDVLWRIRATGMVYTYNDPLYPHDGLNYY